VLGENLIFLASQPRAGSTLVQRILAGHRDVHTLAEPWLLLHALRGLDGPAGEASYDAAYARDAVWAFLAQIPAGEEAYRGGLRSMYHELYQRALAGTGAHFFLDKTPRYYAVLPELVKLFPRARVVLLLRHPLAVLASIYRTWARADPRSLHTYSHDLRAAPELLLAALGQLSEHLIVVRYEELVTDPEPVVAALCAALGLPAAPGLARYGGTELPHFALGDQSAVYAHDEPVEDYVSRWQDELRDPQLWRFASDYLQVLGRRTFAALGYDYDAAAAVLRANRPPFWRRLPAIALPE